MGFKLKAADGTPLEIADGDFYFNTKARGRRMMANSLSSDARRVYACLELATMGWKQELAVVQIGKEKQRPLTPTDIKEQTGLSKQHVRRGLEELENAGLAQRVADDKGALRNGHIEIYSWAVPREPEKEKGSRARLPFPAWFPESWEPLKPLISRFKYSLIDDEVAARGYFKEIAEAARDYQRAEEVAIRALERVCAGRKSASASLSYERTERTLRERTSSSSEVVAVVLAVKAEEEEEPSLYQKFKAQYPADHYDEAKAKPFFDGKQKPEQLRILQRLQVYLVCERWKDEDGRWIPLASNWLPTCDADPPAVVKKKAAAAPAKKGYVESLREEAERRIAKYGRI